jgi:hypothetical protein
MKTKLFAITLLLLSLAWLQAEDGMFGAFRIKTKPKGADVTLYDPDIYLCETPSPVYPVVMDESMELREGIPGRAIMLMITKRGYVPLKKEIFVPFTSEDMQEALDNPSEFSFELEKDYHNLHWRICLFYSYRHRHPHPHFYFDRPNWSPWMPPGHHPDGDGHHHGGNNPPPPPPPPPGGGGHHPGGNDNIDPPHDYGFSTTPVPIPGRSTSKPDPPVIVPPGQKEKPPATRLVPKPEKQDKPDKTQVNKSEKPEKKQAPATQLKEEKKKNAEKIEQPEKKENDSKKEDEQKKKAKK